jgi:DNA-binding NtrC family response regulator
MPTLAERPRDIALLAEHFLKGFAQEFKKPLKQMSPATLEALQNYPWPGNVRELRNVIERLVILEADQVILPKHLPPEIRAGTKRGGKWIIELPATGVALVDVERELVLQAMERAGGNQTHAAELLGIERDALRRRLNKYALLEPVSEPSHSALTY